MAPGHREAQCSSTREPRALRWLLNTRRLLQAKMEPSATAAGHAIQSSQQCVALSAAKGQVAVGGGAPLALAALGDPAAQHDGHLCGFTGRPEGCKQTNEAQGCHVTELDGRPAAEDSWRGVDPVPAHMPQAGTTPPLQQSPPCMAIPAQPTKPRWCASSCKRKSVEAEQRTVQPASAAEPTSKHRRDASRPAPPPTADYASSSFFHASCPELPAFSPATPTPASAPAPAWQHRRQEVLARRPSTAAPDASAEAARRQAERSGRLARCVDAMAAVGLLDEAPTADAAEAGRGNADLAAA